jgi:D-serine deaminase-like pyridoxal phosphate-dependent protein
LSNPEPPPWAVFIKIDVGARRAGLPPDSPLLEPLLKCAFKSKAIKVEGVYAFAGHSYGSLTIAGAEKVLQEEVSKAIEAAKLLPSDSPFIVSFGTTPTAHVVTAIQAVIPPHIHLELHAGKIF